MKTRTATETCTTVRTGAPPGMSIEAIRWALQDAPGVPAQCVSVLVGLAERADKHGRNAYPSAATLAGWARKSERQVRYDLSLLTEAKLIRPGDQSEVAKYPSNRRPMVYDLAMEWTGDDPGVQPTAPQPGVQSASGVQSTAPRQSTAPLSADDQQEQAGVQSTAPQGDESLGCNTAQPGVQPTAYKPTDKPKAKDSSRRRDLNADREDIRRLCAHLVDRLVENGASPRPVAGKQWLDAARLMLDTDGRTEAQVHKAIDWCQADGFWNGVILSMPKLRKQYEALRLQAKRDGKNLNGSAPAAAQSGIRPRDEHRYRK
jgi:hypothetical protein